VSEPPAAGALPWRQGRSVGRTIYDAQDELIGVMDRPDLAERVAQSVNDSAPAPGAALAAVLEELNATRWDIRGSMAEWQRDTIDGRTFAHVSKAIEIIRSAMTAKETP
jgi:hypothetical protein